MMKRGTPDHPKTKHVAKLLGLARWEAVGLLESIWHFASNYAKRGDIGKWSDEQIASFIEWNRCPASEMVIALATAKLLDECADNRLLVHDWSEHADQTVHRSEEVKKLGFAKQVLPVPSSSLANASQPCQSQSQSQSPAKACTLPVANGQKAGKPAAGIFKSVSTEMLRDTAALLAWFEKATKQRKPVIGASEANRRRVVEAAERALECGESPPALFAHIVSKAAWKLIDQQQEQRAVQRLNEFDRRQRAPLPIRPVMKGVT